MPSACEEVKLEDSQYLFEESSLLTTLFLRKEHLVLTIKLIGEQFMKEFMKQAWKKAGVIGDVLIFIDIVCNMIRLYNEIVKPKLTKRSKKNNVSADETIEDA